MISVSIEYLVDEIGNKLDCSENSYADLLAVDISRSGIECPAGHTAYPSITLVLAFDENRKVFVKRYKESCCEEFAKLLHDNLQNWLKF